MPIHMTAQFDVQAEKLEACQQAIREFVEYVRANAPGTLLYTSLQAQDNTLRFLHYFIFRDEAARKQHSNSDAVNRFTDVLYPNLVAPVEFREYFAFASTG